MIVFIEYGTALPYNGGILIYVGYVPLMPTVLEANEEASSMKSSLSPGFLPRSFSPSTR